MEYRCRRSILHRSIWRFSVIVLLPVLPDTAPKWLFIIVMVIFGMIGGAIWGVIPGILKVKFNVNEIISTLMMNYIAVFWNNYFIYAVWSEGGFQMSKTFAKECLAASPIRFAVKHPLDARSDHPPGFGFCPDCCSGDLVYFVPQ